MQIRHFHRAIAMMQAIATAMAMPAHLQQGELNKIGPYRSRGKGRGRASSLSFVKNRSKYEPHYGAKESAKFAAKTA